MSVDLKRGETLPIHINMSFPSLPCEGQLLSSVIHPLVFCDKSFIFLIYLSLCLDCLVLSVDAIDMFGKHEVHLHTNI